MTSYTIKRIIRRRSDDKEEGDNSNSNSNSINIKTIIIIIIRKGIEDKNNNI